MFEVGSLVRARGRDWVVQPGSSDAFLQLLPLGGRSEEATGLLTALEPVAPAHFAPPTAEDVGDARSAGLLRDAARLSFRASAGPFRSFGRIAVEPRPYQLVPLLMALRLEPVRLLIADDMGIGKTVEALLIARELLDRGEARRLAVLCPPHLAEQWQKEMKDKFHLEAELVLPQAASRLERQCRLGESIFERFPWVVVSTDFIKADRRRDEFLRSAPELILVDEAHTCADSGEGRGGRQQRHRLLQGLSRDAARHLILVSATPHSGKEEAFRSLLALLKPEFAHLPEDLSGRENEGVRRELARTFVQRKRGDIRAYLDADTPFPRREDADAPYALSEPYKALFARVLRYAREMVQTEDKSYRQRVRWWAALGLLRALASSPRAAAATLRNRAAPADTETLQEADEVGRRTVLDQADADGAERLDVTPGSQVGEAGSPDPNRERLLKLAREAEALEGEHDHKLAKLIGLLDELLAGGYAPIVFCRFIQTAEYVAESLAGRLPKGTQVAAVTGRLPPEEREARVLALADSEKRVLVATDCLSEGINLQESFDAVLHYDLPWNPTRLEQREGRVDRYGQARPLVQVRTLYSRDNQIDGVVLDVLIKKHKRIRSSLGISVPVPASSDEVVEAIFEGLLLRGQDAGQGQQQALFSDLEHYLEPQREKLDRQWDAAAEREKRSRTMFAQETIKVEEVAKELKAARAALGGADTVKRFLTDAARAYGGTVQEPPPDAYAFNLAEAPQPLRDALPEITFRARFELPVQPGERYLSRTHPITEALATYVLDSALDPLLEGAASRAGAMRTRAVTTRTTLLLLRFRHDLETTRGNKVWRTLAEEARPLAFHGTPEHPEWLPPEAARSLFEAEPAANISPQQAQSFVQTVLRGMSALEPHLERAARDRADALLDAHRRVRDAARSKGLRYRVTTLGADLLGVYVFLPA